MRIALISDIHANEVALKAVLKDIAQNGVDQIVCLGDIVLRGRLLKINQIVPVLCWIEKHSHFAGCI
jgi:predicted phosphodiesterase